MKARYRMAVDVGGTFTDLVCVDQTTGESRVAKVPSTPPEFYGGVVAAFEKITPDFSEVDLFVHGTTAHLNAFLERKGARSALLTTRGFGDVYEMRRGARPEAYDLQFRYPPSLIPRRDIFEIGERIDGEGQVLEPLSEADLDAALLWLREREIKSVAICFLHSYRNPRHEQLAAAYLRERAPELFITPSCEVCREWREYERTSTVALNAYISPILANYLRRLRSALAERGFERKVHLMQSHGGLIGAENAESRGVLTLMSGPVGGNVGCRSLVKQIGEPKLICVDMGGTSFDISLIVDGEPALSSEKVLAGQPVLAPMVDIHTIGAGGGSIARAEQGALRVGPHSAGALPGPACYGRGGVEPTVTDANLLLGRLDASRRFGGDISLNPELSRRAIEGLGAQFGLSAERMAEGILDVINSQMANAIRTMTIRRGIDPREFALVAFGGAGPMHAAFLARELGIQKVIVPGAAGAFSAWGMLETDIRHDLATTFIVPLAGLDAEVLTRQFGALERELAATLSEEGIFSESIHYARSLDMRYQGQEHFIAVPFADELQGLREHFDSTYRTIYGHSNPTAPVEIVNLRVQAHGPLPSSGGKAHAPRLVLGDAAAGDPRADTRLRDSAAGMPGAHSAAAGHARAAALPGGSGTGTPGAAGDSRTSAPLGDSAASNSRAAGATGHLPGAQPSRRAAIFDGREYQTAFVQRGDLLRGATVEGPAIIDEPSCTTVVPPQTQATVLPSGHLLLQIKEARS